MTNPPFTYRKSSLHSGSRTSEFPSCKFHSVEKKKKPKCRSRAPNRISTPYGKLPKHVRMRGDNKIEFHRIQSAYATNTKSFNQSDATRRNTDTHTHTCLRSHSIIIRQFSLSSGNSLSNEPARPLCLRSHIVIIMYTRRPLRKEKAEFSRARISFPRRKKPYVVNSALFARGENRLTRECERGIGNET